METSEHQRNILDQFTRQAGPFAANPGHSNEAIMERIIKASGVGLDDEVLDVACGPGLLACALAKKARQVTGIDLVPAMLEQARQLQDKQQLTNVSWLQGDVLHLPFDSAVFSLVITRYTFHHFLDPLAVLKEMRRVTKAGGTVAIIDVYTASTQQAQVYNHMEKLRDPSHVRALMLDEFLQMAATAGLRDLKAEFYQLEMELERQLQASFPNPGDEKKIRAIFEQDLSKDLLGLGARRQDGRIHFVYPTVILTGRIPSL